MADPEEMTAEHLGRKALAPGEQLVRRPGWRDAHHLALLVASCLALKAASPPAPWDLVAVFWVLGWGVAGIVPLVRSRAIVDATGVTIRRFRTQSWPWTDIERLHRDCDGFSAGEFDERQGLVVVPVDGRPQPLEPWNPSGRRQETVGFRVRVLASAVRHGVDTTPPGRSRSWWNRVYPAPQTREPAEPDPTLN